MGWHSWCSFNDSMEIAACINRSNTSASAGWKLTQQRKKEKIKKQYSFADIWCPWVLSLRTPDGQFAVCRLCEVSKRWTSGSSRGNRGAHIYVHTHMTHRCRTQTAFRFAYFWGCLVQAGHAESSVVYDLPHKILAADVEKLGSKPQIFVPFFVPLGCCLVVVNVSGQIWMTWWDVIYLSCPHISEHSSLSQCDEVVWHGLNDFHSSPPYFTNYYQQTFMFTTVITYADPLIFSSRPSSGQNFTFLQIYFTFNKFTNTSTNHFHQHYNT